MTNEEKIDYMIQSLQVAKDEIAFFEKFNGDIDKRQPRVLIAKNYLKRIDY